MRLVSKRAGVVVVIGIDIDERIVISSFNDEIGVVVRNTPSREGERRGCSVRVPAVEAFAGFFAEATGAHQASQEGRWSELFTDFAVQVFQDREAYV